MKTRKRAMRLPKAPVAILLALALAIPSGSTVLNKAFALATGGKYYNDYSSFEEAEAAADELNAELSREGNVLLKNDGTLPLTGREWVSVFGVGSDSLISVREDSTNASGTIADSLQKAGFKVNPSLVKYYESVGTTIGKEKYDFDGSLEDSFSLYDGAAVVVFTRAGGEGSDNSRNTGEIEDNKDADGDDYGWEHEALANDGTNEYKHYQQLTDSEEALLSYVKKHFNKVIVVLNTANAMEMYNLQNDEGINAILLMERPGETGHLAVGEILNGTVNPSGKLVDEWYTDFTADPTWYNFGDNSQTGSSNIYRKEDGTLLGSNGGGAPGGDDGYYGVDYEEDIYLGYKYYESYYYEMALDENRQPTAANIEKANEWYSKAVTYPFGSGLSYTSFSLNIEGVYTDAACKSALADTIGKDLFESYEGHEAKVKTLHIPVTVKNTGSVAGKEVVQIYVTAPYTPGEVEKSFVTLAGYAKSELLKPGESQSVVVSINVQDFASYDYTDANANDNTGYELDAGGYTVRAMSTSHFDLTTDLEDDTDEYDEWNFQLTEDAFLKLDDFSGNLIENLFSDEYGADGYCDATKGEYEIVYNSLRTTELMADGESSMTLLSRADFDGTFPKSPTEADLTLKDDVVANWNYWNRFGWTAESKKTDYTYSDKETDAWYIEESEIPSSWTQAATTNTGLNAILLSDMAGYSPYDGGVGVAKWEEFMNQLSYEELDTIVETGGHSTAEIPSIGKLPQTESDSPNNLSSTHTWCDETTVASTWNVDLAHKQGIIVGDMAMFKGVEGWWGPGMDTHRSPFSGRNNEYYSQDGLQGGYIAAAVVSGAESRGLNTYIKHFAFNDQETKRDGMNNNSWISEQAMRENNLKVFQMAMQEGGSSAAMTAFARINGVPVTVNYNLLVRLADDEWGWNGVFLTDGYMGVARCTTGDFLVRVGCIQLNLGGSTTVSGEWDATLRDGKGGVTVDGTENYHQYYYVRQFATCLLYQAVNNTANQNGFTTLELKGGEIGAFTQGTKGTSSVGFDAADIAGATSVAYEVTSGSLPDGLTLSESGSLSGTPTASGEFTFTVTATIDKWITREASYTLNVASAFKIDGDALDSAKVGSAYRTAITSDTVNTDEGNYTEVAYEIQSGALPKGLALSSDGIISGTPTEAGTFAINVKVTASKTVTTPAGGPNPFPTTTTTTTIFTYDTELVVAEAAELPATSYTVTFNTNGGSSVAAQTVTEGNSVSVPAAPTKEGYTFTGWYLDEACTATFSFQAGIESDITVYAGWTAVKSDSDTDNGGCGSALSTGAGMISAAAVLTVVAYLTVSKSRKKSSK